MSFKAKTVYLLGTSDISIDTLRFTKIDLTPRTFWGGMKFREGQKIKIDPTHPVHGVLLMENEAKATISVAMKLKGMECEAKLHVDSKASASYAEISSGVVEIITDDQSDHCVLFHFKRKAKMVAFPIRSINGEKMIQ